MLKSIHDRRYRDFIARLVESRLDAHITQQQLAASLGRPQSYVAKIEGFERRLDVVEFVDLAAALNINPLPLIEAMCRQKVRKG